MQPMPVQINPEDVDREIANIDRQIQSVNRSVTALEALLAECSVGAPEDQGIACGEIAGVFGEKSAHAISILLSVQITEHRATQEMMKLRRGQLSDLLRQLKSNILIPQAVPPRRM